VDALAELSTDEPREIDLSGAGEAAADAPRPLAQLPSLSEYYTDPAVPREPAKEAGECVKSLTFSAWNPPPGNRKMRGAEPAGAGRALGLTRGA
jgi:hypothetical protein